MILFIRFWAIAAHLRFIMISYNLISIFCHFTLNHHNRATLKTLKLYSFELGAWVIKHINRKGIKISVTCYKRPCLDGITVQIEILNKTF